MIFTEKNIVPIVEDAIDLGQQGKIKSCKEKLRTIYSCIKENPSILWETPHIASMGKSIILMIHLDLFDDEEENIELAHWAYLFISKGLHQELSQPTPDTAKCFMLHRDRIILLKSFDDFFVDSLRAFYYSDKLNCDMDTYLEQRRVVLTRIPLLILSDIYEIEQMYENLNNDTYLLEVANYLEKELVVTKEELEEASLLHRVLYQYLIKKGLC